MDLYQIILKYVENSGKDTIDYANACKALDTDFEERPIIALGKNPQEVHEKTLAFVKTKTSFDIRPDSFRLTIKEVRTYDGFVQIGGFGFNTKPTGIWDADLK